MLNLFTLLGTLALVGGGMTYFMFPVGLDMGLKTFLNLKEDGFIYPAFVNPPFTSNTDFYLYTIKNPREYLTGSVMDLELKGPYTFKTHITKDNIEYAKAGQTLKYDGHRKLVLDEAKTADMDEKIWLLNPILPGTHKTVRMMVIDRIPFQRLSEPVVFNTVNLILDNFKERLIMRTTPRELLEGRKVEMLESILGLASRFGLGSLVPQGPPDNIFGIAFVQNETIDVLEVWTGLKPSVERFGDVNKFKGKEKMNVWKGSKCNEISGTNGELYKPFIKEGVPLKIFLAPMCRTVYLQPVGDGKIMSKAGIPALEYELSERTYLGSRNNPSNKCFCEDVRTYDCQYDGFITMGPCFFDSPLYFARPSFKGVDSRMKNTLAPDSVEQNFTEKQNFLIDQITGAVLEADLALLAVFKVVKQPYMRDLARLQSVTYAPMFMAHEHVTVPLELVWPIKLLHYMVDYYAPASTLMAAGGAGLLLFRLLFMRG